MDRREKSVSQEGKEDVEKKGGGGHKSIFEKRTNVTSSVGQRAWGSKEVIRSETCGEKNRLQRKFREGGNVTSQGQEMRCSVEA